MAPKDIETEFLFEVRIPQGPHHLIGDGPLGNRRITYPLEGAIVEGAGLEWDRPGGGWGPAAHAETTGWGWWTQGSRFCRMPMI